MTDTLFADRVKESSTTTGTGQYSLAGAVTNFRTFVAAFGNTGKVCYAAIDNAGSGWEIGFGTVLDLATDLLTRDTILASSNAGAAVNWAAGTRTIVSAPAGAVMASMLANNAGTARPAWLPAKGIWLDTNATPWLEKFYDGTDDIVGRYLDSTLNLAYGDSVPVAAKVSAVTAGLTDRGKLFDCSGEWTLGLTAASTLGNGWWLGVRNSGSSTITVDPNGTELVGGTSTLVITPGDSGLLICDGATFKPIGFRPPFIGFSAYRSTDQTGTSGVDTVIHFDTKAFDSSGWYDNTTNWRFTPKRAGKYRVSAAFVALGTNITITAIRLMKNGTNINECSSIFASLSQVGMTVSEIVDMNGSSDYLQVNGNVTVSAGSPTFGGVLSPDSRKLTWFNAEYLGP